MKEEKTKTEEKKANGRPGRHELEHRIERLQAELKQKEAQVNALAARIYDLEHQQNMLWWKLEAEREENARLRQQIAQLGSAPENGS